MQMSTPEPFEMDSSVPEDLEESFFLVEDLSSMNKEELPNTFTAEAEVQPSLPMLQPLIFEGLQQVSRVNLVGIPMVYRRGSNFRIGKTVNKGPRYLKASAIGLKTRKQMSSEDTYVLAPVLMSQEVYEALFDKPEEQFEQINHIASDKALD